MTNMNSIPNERVSDLVDGHVPDGEGAPDIDALLSDRQAVQAWHAYHVIGDVLRSSELAPSSNDHAFLERLERRLAQEPKRPVVTQVHVEPVTANLASANASVFRWKMFAGVAGFALVGVVGLNLWTQVDSLSGAQLVAREIVVPRAPATIVVTDNVAGTMLRDPRLDELMAAHRQLGGHSALQVPAGFLHNATYEGSAR